MLRYLILLWLALAAAMPVSAQERLLLLNEGLWQSDNGTLSYFADGQVVSNQWFRHQNAQKLGDTPNDIIQVHGDLIAIAVSMSNLVQFIHADGTAVAATEDIPNNRRLATDGRYVYVTSYAHECRTTQGLQTFQRGFVAKIDVTTFQVVAATEVGYEPEGIAYYDGHLFVANTGGYAAMENHDYERTVSILDAQTMQLVRHIDTGRCNLYGQLSQCGRYLLINACGDYYDLPAGAVVMDCDLALQGLPCTQVLDISATYSTPTRDGQFLVVGSSYNFLTGGYAVNCHTILPAQVMDSQGKAGVEATLPGTMAQQIMDFASPYGIYVNPYTGYLYATDAGGNVSAGTLHQWSPDGTALGSHRVYINPGHFLALNPQGEGIHSITTGQADAPTPTCDLWGRHVTPSHRGFRIVTLPDGTRQPAFLAPDL